MKFSSNNHSSILPGVFENFKDINYGIILLSVYILFDFGVFQGVYEIVNTLRLPFILSMLTVIYALYLVANKRVSFESSVTKWFVFFVFFLLVYSQISTIQSVEKKYLLTLFLQYLANYIILVTCVKKPYQFIFIIDVWLFAVLHSNIHIFYEGGRIWDSLWLRGENNVGLFCAYAVPFAYFLYIAYRDSIKKYFYLLCLATSVTGVIMANSRGGFVAFAVVAFFCWLFIEKKIRVLILILLVSMLVVQLAPKSFFTELESLEQGTEEGTANERVYSWGLAVDMFIDHPILGVGPSNYAEYFLQYDDNVEGRFTSDEAGSRQFAKRVAHSTQFQWLAEFGIVGVFVLFGFQLGLYRNWKVIYDYKLSNETMRLKDVNILKMMSHANIITQIGFWVAALFISIMHYPFYWLLPAFSEVWKNIYMNYVVEHNEAKVTK